MIELFSVSRVISGRGGGIDLTHLSTLFEAHMGLRHCMSRQCYDLTCEDGG